MARYVIVRGSAVENVAEWDGVTVWSPPEGTVLMQSDVAGPGDAWDGKQFTKIAPPPVVVEISLESRIAALEQQVTVMRAPVK